MLRPHPCLAALAAFILLTASTGTAAQDDSDPGPHAVEADRAAGEAGPEAAASSNDERTLRTLKTETWPSAYRTGNVALLASILDDRFVLIDADGGLTDRETELELLPTYRWTHDRFDYTIDHLEIIEGHTAVVAGLGRATGTRNDAPYCLSYRSSNVLVKKNGRWQAVLSHVSGVETACEETD